MMRTSPVGIDLIKRFEGLERSAYRDIAGVWTIGYGHTEGFRDGRFGPSSAVTEEEAEALLVEDLRERENHLDGYARVYGVALNQNEFDALISFIFNVGWHAFRYESTVRKRLEKGDREGAAEALTWWNKATVNGRLEQVRGLTRRRAAEKALFLTPVEETPNAPLSAAYQIEEDTHAAAEERRAPLTIMEMLMRVGALLLSVFTGGVR